MRPVRAIKLTLIAVCCWSGGTTARRQPRAQQQAAARPMGSGRGEGPAVAAARKLVANKQWEEAETHTRLALDQLPAGSGEDAAPLQLLHGQSLFELQRWGEAVVALQGAAASASPAISERAGRYLGVARQALTHSLFDLRAYSEPQQHRPCVPPSCARLAPLLRATNSCPQGNASRHWSHHSPRATASAASAHHQPYSSCCQTTSPRSSARSLKRRGCSRG